ncbi:MAG TPA: transcriptional regulator [Myxococcales bacterium]|nr:transcriptional regulator [Myxococcales bacterium]
MSPLHSADYLEGLVREICKLPRETEWVELKADNANPQEIGEYISALANGAALSGKAFAYLVWGIDDGSHKIVGTDFRPSSKKVGNEELENWLLRSLSPKIQFRFFEVPIEGKEVVLLEIERASIHPVQFQGQEFVRVGSYKKKLKDFPQKERELWRVFDTTPFEARAGVERVSDDQVLSLLDYPGYFELIGRRVPDGKPALLRALQDDELIRTCEAGGWTITNLGALLFARRLNEFRGLRRKAVRVIVYQGDGRLITIREQVGETGYASGFKWLLDLVSSLVPSNEVIGRALRRTVPAYPPLAIRELIANALIHQDMFATGTGPTIELFDRRIEITNPGVPLVSADRFLDTPPKSRNETLASLMRRAGICEERGTGVDKVVWQAEYYQLPAPLFEVTGDFTRAVLFAPRPLAKMDRPDRLRACYLHACLKYVNREFMTNTSVRERFGIEAHNGATASRLIKEAVEEGLVVPHDVGAGKKYMKYVPFWAVRGHESEDRAV